MKLLHNARFYTLDEAAPCVSALVIQDGRILASGDATSLRSRYGQMAQAHDLGGRAVIPGLTDAHIHLQYYALGLRKVDCDTPSRAECLRRIAERAAITPSGAWIEGHGWNQNNWPEGYGNADLLDEVTTRHPVYLTAKSLHAAWANSAALHLAGISSTTPDPPGGHIGRAPDGQPDGLLFESAMELLSRAIPEPSVEQVAQAIQEAQPLLWRMGLTGVHDFDRRACFIALQTLRQRNELRLRVLKSIPLEDLPHAATLGLRSGFGDDWLRIGGVKLFSDGALGPRTAAMFQPYENEPGNRGFSLLDAEEIFEHGRLAVENGLSLAVHAIGDRANHETLNALQQLRRLDAPSAQTLRHRIEHVQLIHPDDAPRLAQLNIIASMQPIHATSDMEMADCYWGDRAAYSYAWRLQANYGARLAFGSDAPVESPNPFWGLHAAVTRRRSDGAPGPQGWRPEQRLTLLESLHGFTTGPAFAAGWEDRLGKLAPGYLADLLVLDDDPFTLPPDELHRLQPSATMVGGEWVFES